MLICNIVNRQASAGVIVTATQVGYARGIFLVVPLGDVLDRRKLIPAILCGAAAVLLGASAAPTAEAWLRPPDCCSDCNARARNGLYHIKTRYIGPHWV
jgi:MFS family permease